MYLTMSEKRAWNELPPCHYHTSASSHPLILYIFASQEEEPNDFDCQLKKKKKRENILVHNSKN